jgi:CubicO group peptidase (beta-lactamase class C family)
LHDTYLLPDEAAPDLISNFDRDLVPWPGLYELTPSNVSVASLAYTSGGMASTAGDLVKFYERLFSGRLLAPETLDAMAAFVDARDAGTPQMTGYGLSLFRLEVDGEEVWASLGQFIGSMTIVAYSPSRRDIVAVIGNLSVFDVVSVWSGLSGTARSAATDVPLAAVP